MDKTDSKSSERDPPEKLSKIQKEKGTSSSTRRKIDFNSTDEVNVTLANDDLLHENNNATNFGYEKPNLRQRGRSSLGTDLTDSRVQWTREFLDKIKRSNDRHRKTIESKQMKKGSVQMKSNFPLLLQENMGSKGDGINTQIEGEDAEELDYVDNLSDNEEIYPLPTEHDTSDEGEGNSSPKPRFSGWRKPSGTEPKQWEEITQNNWSLSEVLEKEPEDTLMNNPVIQ